MHTVDTTAVVDAVASAALIRVHAVTATISKTQMHKSVAVFYVTKMLILASFSNQVTGFDVKKIQLNHKLMHNVSSSMHIVSNRQSFSLLPVANAAIQADDTTVACVLTALQSQFTRLRSE